MIKILAFYLDFEGATASMSLKSPFWALRYLSGVLHLDLDWDVFTGLQYTHDPNFGSILILMVQKTSLSFKFLFGDLGEARDS